MVTDNEGKYLEGLQKSGRLKILTTPQEFQEMLKLERAIVYLLVDWSGPERVSRAIVHKILSELENDGTPVFQIDTDTDMEGWGDWMVEQYKNRPGEVFGGWGETVLVSKGNMIDCIKYPFHLGHDKTKEKIIEWKTS